MTSEEIKISRECIKNREKRTVNCYWSMFFLHFIIFLLNAPYKNYSLLSSARKRDQLKRGDTGYLASEKKDLCLKYCFSKTCEQSSPVTCAHEEFRFPMQKRAYRYHL